MVLKIPVEISNDFDYEKATEPFRVGIPIEMGRVHVDDTIKLLDESGKRIDSYHNITAQWPDGSIKWLKVDFVVDLQARQKKNCFLTVSQEPGTSKVNTTLVYKQSGDTCEVDTGKIKVTVAKNSKRFFDATYLEESEHYGYEAEFSLINKDKRTLDAVIDSFACLDESNTQRMDLEIKGRFVEVTSTKGLSFCVNLALYHQKSLIMLDVTIHNPERAVHQGNLWDLGDPGSCYFEGLSIILKRLGAPEQMSVSLMDLLNENHYFITSADVSVYQDSSGGEAWNSRNHINKDQKIPLKFKGAETRVDGKIVRDHVRTQPIFKLSGDSCSVAGSIEKFWQNFPNAIEAHHSEIKLAFFPQQFSDLFELQGGEQKTHRLYFDLSGSFSQIRAQLESSMVAVPLSYFRKAQVIPWLPETAYSNLLTQIIQNGVEGENSFFEKREEVDEYGWRNFGDVYADHEKHEYRSKDQLISHYNNQYDVLYGMFRQYIITGDRRWSQLAIDLANHVVDIDIYHTDADRPQYNNGLFWHTDHYLNAYTSTHRTYSRFQNDGSMSEKSGGGPGSEHCYTTGLCLSYFLTGDPKFKRSVIGMAKWMKNRMEGTGSLLERLLKVKSSDIVMFKRVIRGEDFYAYIFPFTRGTGNYLTALMDAYHLSGVKIHFGTNRCGKLIDHFKRTLASTIINAIALQIFQCAVIGVLGRS